MGADTNILEVKSEVTERHPLGGGCAVGASPGSPETFGRRQKWRVVSA